MRIQSPRMDSRRSWLLAKPNVTVKREVPSDSAKLNGLGAPEEHSQSAHAVVARLKSVRSDNLGGRHCAPKSKTLNYWQDGTSCTLSCFGVHEGLITQKESPQVWDVGRAKYHSQTWSG